MYIFIFNNHTQINYDSNLLMGLQDLQNIKQP